MLWSESVRSKWVASERSCETKSSVRVRSKIPRLGGHLIKQIQKCVAAIGIERACGLVGDQKRWRTDDRARDGDTLLLPNRKAYNRGIEMCVDIQTVRKVPDFFDERGGNDMCLPLRVQKAWKRNILRDCLNMGSGLNLERYSRSGSHESCRVTTPTASSVRCRAPERYSMWQQNTGNNGEQSRLPTTRRPMQKNALSGTDPERIDVEHRRTL